MPQGREHRLLPSQDLCFPNPTRMHDRLQFEEIETVRPLFATQPLCLKPGGEKRSRETEELELAGPGSS